MASQTSGKIAATFSVEMNVQLKQNMHINVYNSVGSGGAAVKFGCILGSLSFADIIRLLKSSVNFVR